MTRQLNCQRRHEPCDECGLLHAVQFPAPPELREISQTHHGRYGLSEGADPQRMKERQHRKAALRIRDSGYDERVFLLLRQRDQLGERLVEERVLLDLLRRRTPPVRMGFIQGLQRFMLRVNPRLGVAMEIHEKAYGFT